MNIPFTKYFVAVVCFVVIFSSCKNEKQAYLLQESVNRLQQQNKYMRHGNDMLRFEFDGLIQEYLAVDNLNHLEKDATNFYHEADRLFEKTEAAITSGNRSDANNLYRDYTAFQICYQQLKKRLSGFRLIGLDSNIDAFLNLNEANFASKYCNYSDSGMRRIGLLLLESDALMNESALIAAMMNALTPASYFEMIRAFAISDKHTYKKGEKLEITTMITRPILRGYADIGGQKVAAENGAFYYSRTITENPGRYRIPIMVTIETKKRQETYPAEFIYIVK